MREGSWYGSIRAAGGMAGSLESCQKLMYMLIYTCTCIQLSPQLCVSVVSGLTCTCNYKVAIAQVGRKWCKCAM